MELKLYKKDGTVGTESIQLAEEIFGVEPNDHAIYLAVKSYLANQRQGTHKSKERSEVSGGGKKPWKQKGRGGSRAGTTRSPLWVGGGTVFGPRPHEYRQDLPKKIKRLARKSALSYKVKDEQLFVIEDFSFDAPKTKDFISVLSKMNVEGKKILFLTGADAENVYLSGRNIEKVQVLEARKASTYDILNNQILIMQKSALDAVVNSFGAAKEEEANA